MVIRSKQKLNYSNSKPFNIVLVEPEIPPNTGNIARLCAATSTKLHLVHPLGFKISDKELKRAGLDYWHLLDVKEYQDWGDFLAKTAGKEMGTSKTKPLSSNFWFISTRGEQNIWEVEFNPGDYLIFGSETKGLSEDILNNIPKENIVSIPMNGKTRSLNLSTSAGIVLYEGLRQVVTDKKLVEVVPI
jgi:tRNA (cytidine/uridine-2'-O-)-methyltransferase